MIPRKKYLYSFAVDFYFNFHPPLDLENHGERGPDILEDDQHFFDI